MRSFGSKEVENEAFDVPSPARLARIAGLRDVLIHAYFGVDEAILWNVVETKVPVLGASARRLLLQLGPG